MQCALHTRINRRYHRHRRRCCYCRCCRLCSRRLFSCLLHLSTTYFFSSALTSYNASIVVVVVAVIASYSSFFLILRPFRSSFTCLFNIAVKTHSNCDIWTKERTKKKRIVPAIDLIICAWYKKLFAIYICKRSVFNAYTQCSLELQAVSAHFILVWFKTLSSLSHCYYYYRRFKFLFVAFISIGLSISLSHSLFSVSFTWVAISLGMHHSPSRIDTIFR